MNKYLISITILLLFLFYQNRRFLFRTNKIPSSFYKHGFCKLDNFLKDDIDLLATNIDIVEKKYDFLNNVYPNNPLVTNINRSVLDIIPGENFKRNIFPFCSNSYIKKKLGYGWDIKLKGLDKTHDSKFLNNKYGNFYNLETDISKFNDYFFSKEYDIISTLLEKIQNKIKSTYPDIFKEDYQIFFIFCFCIYPDGEEQEIHRDTFSWSNFKNIHKDVNTKQVFIPLHDTPVEAGPTIMYRKDLIDNDKIRELNNGITIGKLDDIKDHNIKNMFKKAKVQESLKKGDVVIMDNDIYHQGGGNKTNMIRKALLLQFVKL